MEILAADARWWSEERKEDRARLLLNVTESLWNFSKQDREDMRRAWRLYGNYPYTGLGARLYKRRERNVQRALSFNATKSVIDTYVALVTEDEPKITVQTVEADWETQQRAKALEEFLDAMIYETRLHQTSVRCVLDSCIFGTGWLKVYAEETKVCAERVLPWEVLLDPVESQHGDPPCIYQVKWMDRYQLQKEYPEFKARLMGMAGGMFDDGGEAGGYSEMIDRLPVVEAWRREMPGIPGRHTMIVGDLLLLDEPYEEETFPLIPLVRYLPLQGVHGDSLALECEPIQLQINTLLDKIRRSHHLLAAGYWLIENGSNIVSNQLTNQIGHIIRYRGTPPRLEAPSVVAAEIYQHLDRLVHAMYEMTGVPPLQAQGQKPAGLNSGRAQLVYADITNKRFRPCYREYQGWYWRIAKRYISLAREIGESNGGWSLATAHKRSVVRSAKWADANISDDAIVVRLKPTNALASDPEGILEIATTLATQGLIEGPDALAVLTQNEDWESLLDRMLASQNLALKQASAALNEGKLQLPEPEMNLKDAIRRVQEMKLQAVLDGAPDDRIDLLERWLVKAKQMLPPSGPPSPPTQGPPPPPPGGKPNGAPQPPPGPPPPS